MHIDKSVEPLGIQISCLESGGVFVSTVSEHSLASQVGLQVSMDWVMKGKKDNLCSHLCYSKLLENIS